MSERGARRSTGDYGLHQFAHGRDKNVFFSVHGRTFLSRPWANIIAHGRTSSPMDALKMSKNMVSSIPRPPHPQWNLLCRQYSGCRYDIEQLHMQSVISKMRGNSWSNSQRKVAEKDCFQEMVRDLLRRPRKTIWNKSPGFVVLVDATRPLKWDINTCNKIAIFWTTQYVDCPPRNYFHAGIVRQERPQKCNRFIMISIYSELKYETNVMGLHWGIGGGSGSSLLRLLHPNYYVEETLRIPTNAPKMKSPTCLQSVRA